MKNNKLRLKIILSTFATAGIIVILGRIMIYSAGSILLDNVSIGVILKALGKFILVNALPFLTLFAAMVYILLNPLQKAINQLSRGEVIADSLYNKARKTMIYLPKVIMIINILGFLSGGITFALRYQLDRLFSPEYTAIYLTSTFFMALVSAFFQNSRVTA